jgi:hypothetical protein
MKKLHWYIRFGGIILVIAGEIFALFYLHQKISQSLSHREEQKVRVAIDQEQIANLPALKTAQERALAEEQRFTLVYPQSETVNVIRQIETLAKNEGVTLTITQKDALPKKQPTKPGTSTNTEKTNTDTKEDTKADAQATQNKKPKVVTIADKLAFDNAVHVGLEARGEYKAVRNFLHKLETIPYAVDVLGVDIGVTPEDTEAKNTAPSTSTNQPGSLGSPFLLGGSGDQAASVTMPTVTLEEVVASIDTLLYIQ